MSARWSGPCGWPRATSTRHSASWRIKGDPRRLVPAVPPSRADRPLQRAVHARAAPVLLDVPGVAVMDAWRMVATSAERQSAGMSKYFETPIRPCTGCGGPSVVSHRVSAGPPCGLCRIKDEIARG